LAGLDEGVRRFDTATGGLGGSPFAPGAGGNLPTEQFVLMLEDLGVPTGIDLDELLSIAAGLPEIVGHDIASRVAVAGPLPDFGSRG
jgi:hydroxymethylglutaryl-CoA lyase